MNRELDQAAAIMIAIEHDGDVVPGQKCSAVFFDNEDIEREKAFYAKCCRQSGVTDPLEIETLVDARVPSNPYWLVSFKPAVDASDSRANDVRFHRVDDRTGKVVPDQQS